MKKIGMVALALCLALTTVTALSEPMLTNGTNTAWIGENNYFYLQVAGENAKVLNTAMDDLLGMDQERFYALTQTGAIYGILLDGSSVPTVLTSAATEADCVTLRQPLPYVLENGVLSTTDANGAVTLISQHALAACTDSHVLYYVELSETGIATLETLQLDPLTPAPAVKLMVNAPVAMTVAGQYVTLLAQDCSIQVIDLSTMQITNVSARSENTAAAFCINGDLFTFTLDENAHYLLESKNTVLSQPLSLTVLAPTTAPTLQPTAVPTLAPTAQPTARPTVKPTAKATAVPEDDGRIAKGARGNHVKKMQQRLFDLGYPIEKIDGVFGNETLNAVHLFQSAIGYKERSYMSVSNLNKLYDKTAPAYDPYLPLKKDDRSTYVSLMQSRLLELGYDPGKIDGVYGKNTIAAAAEFQLVAGFIVEEKPNTPKQGEEMTREMLMLLFDPQNAPAKPTPTPIPTETPLPTPVPTDVPTAKPTEAPTAKPTEKPTAKPTDPGVATKTDLEI